MCRFSQAMPTGNLLFRISNRYNLRPTQLSTFVEHAEGGALCHDTANRCIDLEGIGLEDGLGYTVTITSPLSTQNRFFRRRKSWKPSESNSKDAETGNDDDPDQRLQIETTTTYAVDEVYRDLSSYTQKQRASSQIASETMTQEIDQAWQNLSAWGLLETSSETAPSPRLEPAVPPTSVVEECPVKYPPPVVLGE
jgi:hypothetical protein